MMPKTPQHILDKKAEYNRKPDVQDKRVEQNKARRAAIRDGDATKGDGTNVHHVKALENGGSNAASNRQVVDASENKGWRKGQKGYKVPNGKL